MSDRDYFRLITLILIAQGASVREAIEKAIMLTDHEEHLWAAND